MMQMVRQATEQDIDAIRELIELFHAESLDSFGLYCDVSTTVVAIKANLATGFVLEDDGEIIGVLGGVIGSAISSVGKVYQELVWYVKPDRRRYGCLLLDYVEKWCKENGIQKILMVHMGNFKKDTMEKYYLRRGYKFLEAHYIKEI